MDIQRGRKARDSRDSPVPSAPESLLLDNNKGLLETFQTESDSDGTFLVKSSYLLAKLR